LLNIKHTNKQLAFVFPGQGSQQSGMLGEWQRSPLVQKTFEEASEAWGKDLSALIWVGSGESLNSTLNAQPALLAAGVALWRVWEKEAGPLPSLLAGHSLGEYTALVCAGAISFEKGIKLVAKRAEYMQAAVPVGEGSMAAILGLDEEKVEAVCKEAAQGDIVSAANFNAPGQIVIAGHRDAVERAGELAKTKGAKRVIPLAVSVPSHCELMRPAAIALEKTLNATRILSPQLPVIHNVDLSIATHPDDIRARLVAQLYSPVRWVETVQHFVQAGIKTSVECGPQKILTGVSKRIDSSLHALAIESQKDFMAALALLG